MNSVFKEFSKGNIRLTTCAKCGKIADKYVEFEPILLILDLLLLKIQVYRHLLFNRIPERQSQAHFSLDQLAIILVPAYVLFDSYLLWSKATSTAVRPVVFTPLKDIQDPHLIWTSVLLVTGTFIIYLLSILLILFLAQSCRVFASKNQRMGTHVQYYDVLLAIVISSFAKVITVLLVIWEYDLNLVMVIALYVRISNIIALKVYLRCTITKAIVIVALATLIKAFTSAILLRMFLEMDIADTFPIHLFSVQIPLSE